MQCRGVTYAYLEGTQRHPATDIIELAVVAGRYIKVMPLETPS